METFTDTRMGKFAVQTIKDDYSQDLSLLILSDLDKAYFEFISEKACELYQEVSDNNKVLNDIEVVEITQIKINKLIEETIGSFPLSIQ